MRKYTDIMLEMSDNSNVSGSNLPLDAHLIIHGDENKRNSFTELNVRSPLSSRHGSISSLNSNNLFLFNNDCKQQINSRDTTTSSNAMAGNVAGDIIDEEEEISNLVQCEHISSANSSSSLSSRGDCRRHHHRRPSVALKFNKPIIYK